MLSNRFVLASAMAVALLLPFGSFALATPHQYTETFATKAACDTLATTALWDTTAHELRIRAIPTTVVGAWDSPGGAMGVAIAGGYAYLADSGSGLQIINIADPLNPTLAGALDTPGSANDVVVAGDYAFVADNTTGLQTINIANPAAPAAAGAYDTPGSAYQVVVDGNYAYVADGSYGLRVVNVSNPAAPVSAGTYDTTGDARDVIVDGDYVYIAGGTAGLQVISVATPATPVLRATLDTPGTAMGLAIAGNYLYLADGTAGLQVIDVSNPLVPVLRWTLDTPGTARNIAIDGDWAYLADVNTQLQMIDLSDPERPVLTSACTLPGAAYNLVLAGGQAYVADYAAGLQVLGISQGCAPVPGGTFDTSTFMDKIILDGNYAYAATFGQGLVIVDISDPASPAAAGVFDTDYASGLDVDGQYAYVSDGEYGLKIVNIRNPALPTLTGSYPTTGNFYDVTVEGDHAFVANQALGVLVLNIANPAAPVFAGSLATTGWAWTVAVDGDFAYVAEYDAGVRVLNVTNPAAPVSLGICNTPGEVTDVAVDGDYVYAAGGTAGLYVIDCRVPASPSLLATCNTPGLARTVNLAGDRAYVGDISGGVQIVDISDPAHPVIVDSYDTTDSTYDVAVAGNYAYLARSEAGVQALRVRDRILAYSENAARSLVLSAPGADLVKLKMTTVQSGSIDWEINAADPAVTPWQSIVPDGTWLELDTAGDRLTWRCTLDAAGTAVSPVCTGIGLTWLGKPALISSVSDIPADQGGRVRLSFARSAYDFIDEAATPITGYQVWRRVDDPALRAMLASEKAAVATDTGDLPLRRLGGRSFLVAGSEDKSIGDPLAPVLTGTFPSGTWEAVGTILPTQQDEYLCPVPTLADSATTIPWTVICVTAHTAVPSVWYASPPDSGWSVDNIAPQVPTAFTVAYGPGANTLAWDACPDRDFAYFRLYRGSSAGFEPAPENLTQLTTATAWTDADTGGLIWHYKITAVDDAENESGPASPQGAVGVAEPSLPRVAALHPVAPNPFNPATTIAFDLAQGERVRLEIFDAAGRRVCVLLDELRAAGAHRVRWDGLDANGQSVASGVYFCRLDAGTFRGTRRMTLVR